MTTKRNLKSEVEELSPTGDDDDRQLRQELPSYRYMAEWERLTGADMSYLIELKECQQ